MVTYYFSTSGSNSNSGTSSGSPFLDTAGFGSGTGGASVSNGDQFLFNKGDTWTNPGPGINMTAADGVSTANVTVGTYGSGAAPVVTGMYVGVHTYEFNGSTDVASNTWTVTGLNFGAGANGFIAISGSNTSQNVSGITVSNCSNVSIQFQGGVAAFTSTTISGNTNSSLSMAANTNNPSYTTTSITSNTFTSFSVQQIQGSSLTYTGNTCTSMTLTGCTGTVTYGGNNTGALTLTSCSNVTVSGQTSATHASLTTCTSCTVSGSNFSGPYAGDGILVSGGSGNTIDQCGVTGAGYLAATYPGPAGIRLVSTSTGTVTRCAVYGVTTLANEGSGIMLDVSASSCTVQYNLVYNCAGAGIHVYGNPFATGHTGNIVRYNLTWHNCQATAYYGELTISHQVLSSTIFNNTHIAADYGTATAPAVLVRGKSASSVTARNSIFVSGTGALVKFTSSALTTSAVLFQGNGYYRPAGFSVDWFGTAETSLGNWQSATTQEKNGGTAYGTVGDPLFVDSTSTPAVTSPSSSISAANGLKLQAGSPYVTNALNLNSLFGTTIGTRDYFNNTLSNPWSVGGAEF